MENGKWKMTKTKDNNNNSNNNKKSKKEDSFKMQIYSKHGKLQYSRSVVVRLQHSGPVSDN